MAIQTQLRRGTTAQHSSFTGAAGEVTVDTDLKTLRIHDASLAGGHRVALYADLSTANVTEGANLYFTDNRARAAISVTGSGTYDNTTGIINITASGGGSTDESTVRRIVFSQNFIFGR